MPYNTSSQSLNAGVTPPVDITGYNGDMARSAAAAMTEFHAFLARQPGHGPSGQPLPQLLAGMRHWADRNGLNWGHELFEGMENYRIEAYETLDKSPKNPFATHGPDTPPEDPDRLNDLRANAAAAAVTASVAAGTGDADFAFRDLLTNARHWCDRNGVVWEHTLAQAMEAYGVQVGLPGMPTQPADYLLARGFTEIDTGGGNTAWSRVVPHGECAWEIMVTAADDLTSDIKVSDAIDVGLYELEHFGTDEEERASHTTFYEALSFGDLPAKLGDCLSDISHMPTEASRLGM